MIQRSRSGTKLNGFRSGVHSNLSLDAFLLVDDYGSLLPSVSRYALFHLLGSLLLWGSGNPGVRASRRTRRSPD